jgi:hypothetical protein
MGCGFPTVCGVVAWLSASPTTSEPGNGWKPLVSLTDRTSCSCFVRLCVSEGRFVTSGPEIDLLDWKGFGGISHFSPHSPDDVVILSALANSLV